MKTLAANTRRASRALASAPAARRDAALTVHLVHRPGVDPARVLALALDLLHHRHGGLHATIQVEPPGADDWHGHEVCSGRE